MGCCETRLLPQYSSGYGCKQRQTRAKVRAPVRGPFVIAAPRDRRERGLGARSPPVPATADEVACVCARADFDPGAAEAVSLTGGTTPRRDRRRPERRKAPPESRRDGGIGDVGREWRAGAQERDEIVDGS
ncbi:MAG: hypothetical protein BJ554DRAFT_2436, partial [Olpidium bornovanus]